MNEAKMLCKPILVTNYPTVADQIDNMENGVITGLDAESLADGIMKTLQNEQLQKHLVDTLRNTDFSDNNTKAKYMSLFGLAED